MDWAIAISMFLSAGGMSVTFCVLPSCYQHEEKVVLPAREKVVLHRYWAKEEKGKRSPVMGDKLIVAQCAQTVDFSLYS